MKKDGKIMVLPIVFTKLAKIFKNSIIVSVSNIVLSVLLVQFMGFYGIVVGTVLSSLLSLGMIIIRLKKSYGLHVKFSGIVLEWGKNKKITKKFFTFCLEKGNKGGKKLQEKAGRNVYFALFLFVGIPLPGTGAWTGRAGAAAGTAAGCAWAAWAAWACA